MTLRLGLASLNQTPLDWQRNLANLSKALRWAKQEDIHLLATPELSLTGYGCEDFFFSDWLYKKALHLLTTELVPQTKGIMLAVGLPLKHRGKRYISLCVVENLHIKGFYVKQKLASEDVYYESRWFEAWPKSCLDTYAIGNERYPIGEKLFVCRGSLVGFEICEDAWQSERPLTRYTKQKVDLVINTSASHFVLNKHQKRQEMVNKSAAQYQIIYAYVNALGNEAGTLIYDGDQYVSNAQGPCYKGPRFSSKKVLCAQVTLPASRVLSQKNKVFGLEGGGQYEECTRALSLALRDYYQKSKMPGGFVLSLSGGADSAMCAILVSEMQRRHTPQTPMKNLLLTLYQRSNNSSEATLQLARKLSEELACTFSCWSIQAEFEAYKQKVEELLGRVLKWETDAIALQNLQARVRVPGLWLLANLRQALLINTSNRSELSVGYATADGDMAGSIAPIAGLNKTFVREYLVYAQEHYGYETLKPIAQQAPSAELMPPSYQQQDEKDLMPYDTLALSEQLLLNKRLSIPEIHKKLTKKQAIHLSKFLHLFQKNQWKRERAAPGFSIDTLNLDPKSQGRYPILMGDLLQ